MTDKKSNGIPGYRSDEHRKKYRDYLKKLEEKNRLMRAASQDQIDKEDLVKQRENGFQLYVNGAHTNRPSTSMRNFLHPFPEFHSLERRFPTFRSSLQSIERSATSMDDQRHNEDQNGSRCRSDRFVASSTVGTHSSSSNLTRSNSRSPGSSAHWTDLWHVSSSTITLVHSGRSKLDAWMVPEGSRWGSVRQR